MSKSENITYTPDRELNDSELICEAASSPLDNSVIIIGAGTAGLSAAYELITRTDIIPIIFEKSAKIGGDSKPINYKGNIIDSGGTDFVFRSKRAKNWWLSIVQSVFGTGHFGSDNIGKTYTSERDAEKLMEMEGDETILNRSSSSQLYFVRKFFSSPFRISRSTLIRLGTWRALRVMISYLKAFLFPHRPEKNLEDFIVNRFGKLLYEIVFRNYTEKLWGRSCQDVSPELGEKWMQEISIVVRAKQKSERTNQTNGMAEGADEFLYPKVGQGQFWDEVAKKIEERGGKIFLNHEVRGINTINGDKVRSFEVINMATNESKIIEGEYLFSTIPIRELIEIMGKDVPGNVKEVSLGLKYRSSITVGILLKRLSYNDRITGEWKSLILGDTCIYIGEMDVKVSRIRIFNNWSSLMVNGTENVWIGMDFFCDMNDDFWGLTDGDLKFFAISELTKLGLAVEINVLDATVLREEEMLPIYDGTYSRLSEIRKYTDGFDNLFLLGCNGTHRYRSLEHSISTAMVAVDSITENIIEKGNVLTNGIKRAYRDAEGLEEEKDLIIDKNVAMDESTSTPGNRLWNFIFRDIENVWYLRIGIAAIIVQIFIFKCLYPYAGFINGDSYVYLETAYHNLSVNTYPIGYSMFLRLFSVFSKSDTILVVIQYFLVELSVMAFIFTLFYFYRPIRITKILLFGFMLFNPVFLFLANYISSDSFFLVLSMIWFTQLFWIVNFPTDRLIIINAFILFAAFTVRYNALFYPTIAILALFQGHSKTWRKIGGLVISFLLIGIFIQFSSNKYLKLTGHRQFTPFTGWQTANNAMYAYRYVNSTDVKPVPRHLQALDRMVRTYFDTTRDVKKYPQEALVASTVYMWAPNSPLSLYMEKQFTGDSTASALKKWATVSPVLAEYGKFLIRTYPKEYIDYYLIPNAFKYYAPPVEFLETYSTGVDSVSLIAKIWFDYKTVKLKTYFKDYNVTILNFYPVLTGTMNVVLLFSLISFLLLKGYRQYPKLKNGMLLVIALWVVNFGFSVFASPIALRFQLFPILVSFSFTLFLIEYLVRSATNNEENVKSKSLTRKVEDVAV